MAEDKIKDLPETEEPAKKGKGAVFIAVLGVVLIAGGIGAGLFFGKQFGVFGVATLAVKTGLAAKPDEISWKKLYGVSCLAGIGFTMSLFIGSLAFSDPALNDGVRLGVLTGSIMSGLLGALILSRSSKREVITYQSA